MSDTTGTEQTREERIAAALRARGQDRAASRYTPPPPPKPEAAPRPTLQEYLDQKAKQYEAQHPRPVDGSYEQRKKWDYKYGKMLDYERRNFVRQYQGGKEVNYFKINQQAREAEELREFYEKNPSLAPGVQTDQRTGRAVLVKEGSAPKNTAERLRALQGGAFNYTPPTAAYVRQEADGSTTGVYARDLAGKNAPSVASRQEAPAPASAPATEQPRPTRSKYTGGQGSVSAAPEKPSIKLFSIFDTGKKYGEERPTASTLSAQAQALEGSDDQRAAELRIKALGVGVMTGASAIILQPKEVALGIKNLITHPIDTTRATVETFKGRPDVIGTPEAAIGEFIGGTATMKVLGDTTAATYRAGKAGVTYISPNYRPVTPEPGTLGVIKEIPTSKGPQDVKLAGAIGSKTLPAEDMATQAARAGTEVEAVSGARNLFGIFKREIKVDKPLPTPDASPLEKSFFADPAGRLRPSRLGLAQEERLATPQDILSGNFQVLPDRPQAIIFPRAAVEKFPERLRPIQEKLLRNEPLSKAEEAALLEFQTTPSGQWKPVGFLSTEPEVTLAAGEVIRRVSGQGAVTLIRRPGHLIPERVPIIEAEIVGSRTPQASPTTAPVPRPGSASSPIQGTPYLSPATAASPILSAARVRNGSAESGASPASRAPSQPPSSPLKDSSPARGSSIIRINPQANPSKGPQFKPSPNPSPYKTPSGSPNPFTGGSPSPTPKANSPNPSPIPRPPSATPRPGTPRASLPRPPLPTPKRKEAGKTRPGYGVEIRQRGQFRPFTTQGLRLEDAAEYAERFVDNHAAASFKIVDADTRRPVGNTERRQVESLLRPGRFGMSKRDADVFVEKSTFRISTQGEKAEIRPKRIFGAGGLTGGRRVFA